MADIAMCANTTCPLRGKCYRYRAIPDMYQTYAGFAPTEDKEYCYDFWLVFENQKLKTKTLKQADAFNKRMTDDKH